MAGKTWGPRRCNITWSRSKNTRREFICATYSIGLDLGGTNLRAAAIDRSGKMLDKISGATNFTEGREAVLSDIVAAIQKLRVRHGATGLAGIGVGVPGFIRIQEGFITGSNNMPYLENFPVRDEIGRRLGTPVILENDANAAALGEKWMGAGREVDDLVLLTLGTGIGGGIISGGRVLRGYVGMAGELGHMTVVPNGNPCGCGNQGCLEKHASATAVVAMADMLHLGENLTSKDVCDIAAQRRRRRRKSARHLARDGRIAGHRAGHAGERLQLPAVSAERRHVAGVGILRARNAADRRAALLHLPRHQGRDAHRPGHAGQRSRTLRRGVPAVGREVGSHEARSSEVAESSARDMISSITVVLASA